MQKLIVFFFFWGQIGVYSVEGPTQANPKYLTKLNEIEPVLGHHSTSGCNFQLYLYSQCIQSTEKNNRI